VSKKLIFDAAHLARNLFGGSLFRFISTKRHGRSARLSRHTARNSEETSAKDVAPEVIFSIIPLNNLHVSTLNFRYDSLLSQNEQLKGQIIAMDCAMKQQQKEVLEIFAVKTHCYK